MTSRWIAVIGAAMACGDDRVGGSSPVVDPTPALVVELADGGPPVNAVGIAPGGQLFATAFSRLLRLAGSQWIDEPMFSIDFGTLSGGFGNTRDGHLLLTTAFFDGGPNRSALWDLADDGTLTPLVSPISSPLMRSPLGLPSGHVYLDSTRFDGTTATFLWNGTGDWQSAPLHTWTRHARDGVLARTDAGVVSIDGPDDEDTLLAPCALFPEPCDQLRVAGATGDDVYVTGLEPVIYAVRSGKLREIPLPAGKTQPFAGAVDGGLVVRVTSEGQGATSTSYELYSVRPGGDVLVAVDAGRVLTFSTSFTVTNDGRLFVFSGSWLAEVTF